MSLSRPLKSNSLWRRLERFLSAAEMDEKHTSELRFDLLLRIYFALFFFVISNYFVKLIPVLAEKTLIWEWPLGWLAEFNAQRAWVFSLFALLLLFSALAALFPFHRGIKILLSLLTFLVLPAYYASAGRMYHELYVWLFTSVMLIPLANKQSQQAKADNIFYWRCAQASVLFIYFLAGLWKIRGLMEGYFLGIPLEDLLRSIGASIAENILDGGKPTPAGKVVMQFPAIGQFAIWLSVVYLEVGSFFIIWRPKAMPLWGIFLLLMHFFCGLVMDIPYTVTALADTFFFIGIFPSEEANPLKQFRLLPGVAGIYSLVSRILRRFHYERCK